MNILLVSLFILTVFTKIAWGSPVTPSSSSVHIVVDLQWLDYLHYSDGAAPRGTILADQRWGFHPDLVNMDKPLTDQISEIINGSNQVHALAKAIGKKFPGQTIIVQVTRVLSYAPGCYLSAFRNTESQENRDLLIPGKYDVEPAYNSIKIANCKIITDSDVTQALDDVLHPNHHI